MGGREEETSVIGTSLVGKKLGGVTIESELGRGAMGVVYRGTQVALGRPVAVKVISEAGKADSSFIQRFHREARAIAAVTHPNLVGVYDVGEEDGVTYMVQEFIDGQNLGDVVKAEGALDPADAARIFAQAASGLAAAHARGIVHRDVKPDNLMVSADGSAKVTDFGLAKEQDSDIQLTATGMIWGSPAYIAPELCNDGTPSPASDLYALGASFFQTVTGKVPYEGAPMTVLMKHVQEPIPDPRQLVPELSADHAQLISVLMAKEPGDRIQDAEVAAEAFRRLADGKGISDLLPQHAGDDRVVVGTGSRTQLKLAAAGVGVGTLLVLAGLFGMSGPGDEGSDGLAGDSDGPTAEQVAGVRPEPPLTPAGDSTSGGEVAVTNGVTGASESPPDSGSAPTPGSSSGQDVDWTPVEPSDPGQLAESTGPGTGSINLAGPEDLIFDDPPQSAASSPAPLPGAGATGAGTASTGTAPTDPVPPGREPMSPDPQPTTEQPVTPERSTREVVEEVARETVSENADEIGRRVGNEIGERVGISGAGDVLGGILSGVLGGQPKPGNPGSTAPTRPAPPTRKQVLELARTKDEEKHADSALKAGVPPELVRDILRRAPGTTPRIEGLPRDARKKAERLAKEVKEPHDKGKGRGKGKGKGKGKK